MGGPGFLSAGPVGQARRPERKRHVLSIRAPALSPGAHQLYLRGHGLHGHPPRRTRGKSFRRFDPGHGPGGLDTRFRENRGRAVPEPVTEKPGPDPVLDFLRNCAGRDSSQRGIEQRMGQSLEPRSRPESAGARARCAPTVLTYSFRRLRTPDFLRGSPSRIPCENL